MKEINDYVFIIFSVLIILIGINQDGIIGLFLVFTGIVVGVLMFKNRHLLKIQDNHVILGSPYSFRKIKIHLTEIQKVDIESGLFWDKTIVIYSNGRQHKLNMTNYHDLEIEELKNQLTIRCT